jgi:hypothetical protein
MLTLGWLMFLQTFADKINTQCDELNMTWHNIKCKHASGKISYDKETHVFIDYALMS